MEYGPRQGSGEASGLTATTLPSWLDRKQEACVYCVSVLVCMSNIWEIQMDDRLQKGVDEKGAFNKENRFGKVLVIFCELLFKICLNFLCFRHI